MPCLTRNKAKIMNYEVIPIELKPNTRKPRKNIVNKNRNNIIDNNTDDRNINITNNNSIEPNYADKLIERANDPICSMFLKYFKNIEDYRLKKRSLSYEKNPEEFRSLHFNTLRILTELFYLVKDSVNYLIVNTTAQTGKKFINVSYNKLNSIYSEICLEKDDIIIYPENQEELLSFNNAVNQLLETKKYLIDNYKEYIDEYIEPKRPVRLTRKEINYYEF